MEKRNPLTRRGFLGTALLAGLGSALLPAWNFLGTRGGLAAAQLAPADLVHDTFYGLFAFVVPGSDDYSTAQGVSTAEPGGVNAGAVDRLIALLDMSTPFVPSFSAIVATILNQLALSVNPAPTGTLASPFARLSFAEKAAVFQIMDATDGLKLFGALLPPFVGFFSYSDAGAFDPVTRSLTGQPVGWDLSNYQGVSDGRNEFLGYFHNRRRQ